MTLQNAFEGLATEAKQDLANTALGSLLTELGQKLEASDISALATAAKQDAAKTVLDTVSATLTAIDGHVDGLETKDFATQTTLAAVLAKIIAAPATEAKQDTIITSLSTIDGHVDGLEGKDFATQTTLASVLTELGQKLEPSDLSALSTAAKQDAAKTVLDTVSATLTAIDGHVDGLEGKDYATQTTLAALLAKVIAAPATEAKQDTIVTSLGTIDGHVDGLEGKLDTLHTDVTAGGQHTILDAGSAVVGKMGLDPATATGWSISKLIAAATTNATSVKTSAGKVGGWYLFNASASTRYLKLYNKASSPTVGTDTPVMTIPIPAGGAANVEFTSGIAFATGIAFAITGGLADNDTTAVTASDVVVNLLYI